MHNYRNKYEIAIYRLERSGSHAVINWIASMFGQPVHFFNKCSWNPFNTQSYYPGKIKGTPIESFFVEVPRLRRCSKDEINEYRHIGKDCLMYSFKNYDLRKLNKANLKKFRYIMVGTSQNTYSILILRDVFNWLASELMKNQKVFPALSNFPKYNSGVKNWAEHASIIPLQNYLRMKKGFHFWKMHAEEFLGKTKHLEDQKICISFNRWVTNEDYRIKTAELLGLKNLEYTLKYVARGGRSSFDDFEYEGRAQEMKIIDRWKSLKDNAIYLEFLDSQPEVKKLSYEIFGEEIGKDL